MRLKDTTGLLKGTQPLRAEIEAGLLAPNVMPFISHSTASLVSVHGFPHETSYIENVSVII